MQQRAGREAVISVSFGGRDEVVLGEKVTQRLRILMAKYNGVKIIEDGNNSLQKLASNVGG